MSVETTAGATTPRPARFDEALARIRSIVGVEHVLDGTEQIAPRARDTLPAVRMPAAMVYPADVEQVSAVVRIAGELGLTLWPVSRGRNWAYGAATPSVAGSVVLSLERLNRIVEVDEELGYAVVEPGVTYAQLQEHLDRHRIRLWIDPTESTPYGSVIGNALDRGLGTTPYGDHFGNLCGLEVVLPDGQVVQTGAGGLASKVAHTYKWGAGPYLEGLFGQSGFGIVTRAGVWLMPAPEAFSFYALELEREEDLAPVLDAMRRLVLGEVVRTRIHLINDVARLLLVTRCPYPPGSARTHLSAGEVAALRRRHGVPAWLMGGGLYGTPEQVRVQQRELARAVGRYGRLSFVDERRKQRVEAVIRGLQRARAVPGLARPVESVSRRLFGKSLDVLETFPDAFERARGRPTEHFLRFAYYKARQPAPDHDVDPARDGAGLVWLAPSFPFRGRDLTALIELSRPLFAEYGFDYAAAVMPHNVRALAFIVGIHYYKDDRDEAARAEALYTRLRSATTEAGYPPYRVSAPHQDDTLDHMPAVRDLADRLKRALDPAGFVAPGRYGVGRRG